MGLSGTGSIMKLVAFILVTVAFALSVFVFKGGSGGNFYCIPAVFGGFFGYYLADFLGMLLGQSIDTEASKTWAIYACIALFGIGLHTTYSNTNCGDNNTPCVMVMIAGLCAICAAVFCFLDAFFAS